MIKRFIVLMALCFLALVATCIGSCDKLKDISGNLAGVVQDSNGVGIGYMSVALMDATTGSERDRQNAEDRGNFFFQDVKGGTYTIKLYDIVGNEIPIEPIEVKLGTGRTKTITIKMLPPSPVE